MLTENAVVAAVCTYLESRGYEITQRLTTSQRGHDIIAVKRDDPRSELHVEAKGETSNRQGSGRFGDPFNGSQVRDHVANAFYCAAAMLQTAGTPRDIRVGIALPDTALHHNHVARIGAALETLGIAVFWVSVDQHVRVEPPWSV